MNGDIDIKIGVQLSKGQKFDLLFTCKEMSMVYSYITLSHLRSKGNAIV